MSEYDPYAFGPVQVAAILTLLFAFLYSFFSKKGRVKLAFISLTLGVLALLATIVIRYILPFMIVEY